MALYYNYDNVKISVNNQSVLADNFSFSLSNSLQEKQEIDKKGDFNYAPSNGSEVNVSLSYFLTGADPLRPFLTNDSFTPLTAGGMTLQKGYLTSYSINAGPHGPVKVSASLQFYEDFGGTFTPETVANVKRDYLKFSDMTLTLAGINATSKITSLNYSFNCPMDPLYRVGEVVPSEVRYGSKGTALTMDTYNFQEALSYVGKDVLATFVMGSESYTINGTLSTKEVNIEFGQKISSRLSVISNSYGEAPVLRESNTGAQKSAGDYWHVYGYNLLDTTAVYFNNNIRANEFTTLVASSNGNDSEIKVKIPRFARSGPIKVFTPYGEALRSQRAGGAPIVANISPTYIP